MERPCGGCERVRIGEPYDITKDCRFCWLYHHNREYNIGWGGDGDVTPVKGGQQVTTIVLPNSARAGPCRHLSKRLRDDTGTVVQKVCEAGCKKGTLVDVFVCLHPAHGTTTAAECLRCQDYEKR